MWWKLAGLGVLTAALVFAVIPIRTHAVVYDPVNEPPPEGVSFGAMLGNMYFTPGTVLLIVFILTAAGVVAHQVVRGRW